MTATRVELEIGGRLQAEGRVVAMVGDGVNDAADVAIEASDITLDRGDQRAAADAVRLSRRTLCTIKGNLCWAFARQHRRPAPGRHGVPRPDDRRRGHGHLQHLRRQQQPAAARVPHHVTLTRRFLSLLAVPALVLLSACGSGDDPSTVAGSGSGDERTIEVEMRDIAFAPTAVGVGAGEKVRFVFTNTGQVTHDAFVGDQAAQDEHEKEMRGSHSGMGKEPNAVSVGPGKKRTLTYTFDQPGQVLIGCHQPGHYTGGMKATVNVA